MGNEWRFTHGKRINLTKEKNNTHKQRNYLMMSVHSNDQAWNTFSSRRISTDAIKWHSFLVRWPNVRQSCDRAHECRIVPYRHATHEKRITLTWEKNNTHKQRKLLYDERPVKGSNGHEMNSRQISTTDAKKWHSFVIRRLMRRSCDRVFKGLVTSAAYGYGQRKPFLGIR